MSDQTSVGGADTAVVPSPGYYPDPSVPGFVRYWNGGAWVPGTSRAAPAAGEVLEVPRFAVRPNPRPNARYIPPPVAMPAAQGPVAQGAVAQVAETGPVFLDQTSAGASFAIAPQPVEASSSSAWRADPQAQRGLMETGSAPRWVSWGIPEGGEAAAPAPAPAPAAAPVPAVVPVPAPAPVPVSVPAPVSAALPALRKSAEPTSGSSGGSGGRSGGGAAAAVHRKRSSAVERRTPARPVPARAAGLGRRAAAQLLDSVVLVAVGAATVLPFLADTEGRIQARVAQARAASLLTGHEVQVWLLDGVVVGRLVLLLGVLLIAGFLGEVLPTARTGRTLGKRLLGLRVVAADARRPPALGRSLLRWLVRQLSMLTIVGLFALLFSALSDRQARRGWHDRAAGTKVVEGRLDKTG